MRTSAPDRVPPPGHQRTGIIRAAKRNDLLSQQVTLARVNCEGGSLQAHVFRDREQRALQGAAEYCTTILATASESGRPVQVFTGKSARCYVQRYALLPLFKISTAAEPNRSRHILPALSRICKFLITMHKYNLSVSYRGSSN